MMKQERGHCVSLQVGCREYDLILNSDVNACGRQQWFYFRVCNMQPDVAYTFNVVNMEKSRSLFNQRSRPVPKGSPPPPWFQVFVSGLRRYGPCYGPLSEGSVLSFGFNHVSPGSTALDSVSWSFHQETAFLGSFPGFTGFYWVLLCFNLHRRWEVKLTRLWGLAKGYLMRDQFLVSGLITSHRVQLY